MDWNLVGNILAIVPLVGIAGVVVFAVKHSSVVYESDPDNN